MTSNTLLVVIDDDISPDACLGRAVMLAKRLDADLSLFSAIFDPYVAGERFADSSDLEAAKQAEIDARKDTLRGLAAPLRADGLTVSIDVAWDEPLFEAIVRQAMRTKPRMVLRTNHYHSALRRALFSNDDWNLIRTCPVPLYIVRADEKTPHTLSVAAAVDPTHAHDKPADLDANILSAAKTLVNRDGDTLCVVHSYDAAAVIAGMAAGAMTPILPDTQGIEEQVRAEHLQAVQQLLEREQVSEDKLAHLSGNARTVLPEFVRDNDVDVLIMGAVSRGFIKRAFIGNTAEQLLNQLSCDVMIVKPDGFESAVEPESRHRDTEH